MKHAGQTFERVTLLCCGLAACSLLSGCLVVGYSSRSGAFVWPGGIGLLLLLLLLWFLFRGR